MTTTLFKLFNYRRRITRLVISTVEVKWLNNIVIELSNHINPLDYYLFASKNYNSLILTIRILLEFNEKKNKILLLNCDNGSQN